MSVTGTTSPSPQTATTEAPAQPKKRRYLAIFRGASAAACGRHGHLVGSHFRMAASVGATGRTADRIRHT